MSCGDCRNPSFIHPSIPANAFVYPQHLLFYCVLIGIIILFL
uniref:MIP37065p1 n=1 Tax=Drosophila melanogaster TaxID=7227 RepID=R9UE14_DROME|nr:MIP37065p1 [Drosophila melanogaster]